MPVGVACTSAEHPARARTATMAIRFMTSILAIDAHLSSVSFAFGPQPQQFRQELRLTQPLRTRFGQEQSRDGG
jgi:hypothetical protein